MRVYTIHLPPASQRIVDPALVKEGFSWPAFLFGPLWALAKGMWLTALALIALDLASGLVMDAAGFNPLTEAIVSLAIAFLIGAHANDWRRRALARRAWRDAGVVAARNVDEALARYLDAEPARVPPRPRVAPAPPPPMPLAGV
ncbi:MAG: DUF2628 domain-containing protein [Gemmatimonas sp.]